MDATAKVEQSREYGEGLEQIAQRFKRWREGRARGEHIPEVLWAAAVGMAREHGLHRVACELHVDQNRLKKRLERAGGVARAGEVSPQFVELMVSPAPRAQSLRECVVELENARGAKMRVELNGNGLAGLAGLCSSFWSAA
ncbi:MAG: hypothetical protein WB579_15165 [Bryobacteraceae bacterium]